MPVMLDEATWAELLRWQEELEAASLQDGVEAFYRRLDKATERGMATTVGGARKLLREGLSKVEAGIQAMIDQPAGKGLGKRHMAAKWCKQVGPDVAAYLTLQAVLNAPHPQHRLIPVAQSITKNILDELRYRRFREQAPQLFDYKLRTFATNSYAHMARSIGASMRFAGIDVSDLSLNQAQQVRVGTKLIDILIETTGLVEVYRPPRRIRSSRKRSEQLELRLCLETTRWMERYNAGLSAAAPMHRPMVVPPLEWGPDTLGGYRFSQRGVVSLIGGPASNRMENSRQTSPLAFSVLNTLQRTPWQINRRVLETVEALLELGGGVAGLSDTDEEPLPAKPANIAEDPVAKKFWKRRAQEVRSRNVKRRQRSLYVDQTVHVAKTLRDAKAFFFPYKLDFRGRVYPVAGQLNPQGSDLDRGLLTFAEGKPLDQSGAKWLAIHGANCLGDTPQGGKVSKMTLDERMEWVVANSQRIVDASRDPIHDLWWTKADKPLQFLAFCFEWDTLLQANARGEVYVCSLPCSMDGSCNGLQHFAAMFRDEGGGRAVNVVPQDRPQDVYQIIADMILTQLEREAASGEDRAKAMRWLGAHARFGLLDRKFAKRPTMTFGYGSKVYGFREQILQYLKEHEEWNAIRDHLVPEVVTGMGLTAMTAFMARIIWESLSQVVVAAFDGMEWLQAATRGISKQNEMVTWTVPMTGFVVRQGYMKMRGQRVHTVLAGSVIAPTVNHATNKVDPRKQANGIAPNFVHSLDAAALMLTVNAASNAGLEHFAMVHDSYGTLPSDCEVLARCCRQAFAALYMQQDVVGLLYKELQAQWAKPEECPAPPAKGDLDVSQVLASTYFFA